MGDAQRKRTFDADTELPRGFVRIEHRDYTNSGFDRGHMCPHGDRDATTESSYATFVMTNIIAQSPKVNQGNWADLESYCRQLVAKGNRLYITAGPHGQGGAGTNGEAKTIAAGKVSVPAECWKVIVVVPLLRQASDGLLYPSESDAPFDVFSWKSDKGTAAESVADNVGMARRISEVPTDTFFSELADSDNALQFRRLHEVLVRELPDLRIYRVGEGERQVDIYVIGRQAGGGWAGLHTVSIET